MKKLNSKFLLLLISLLLSSCGGGASSSASSSGDANNLQENSNTDVSSTTPVNNDNNDEQSDPPVVTPPITPSVPEQTLENTFYNLDFINSYWLDVAEPSGLSWALDGNNFLVVDDRNNQVFKINKQGETLSGYQYEGDDLEGVSIDPVSQTIWVAEEAKSKIVELDSAGNKIQSFKLDIDRESKKHSLEGISYDATNHTFYILNEDKPGLLITWRVESGIVTQKTLDFAKDFSGVYYDENDHSLWIISDRSEKLYHCDTDGKVLQSFDLGINKSEGIVVDSQNERVYIVSDSKHKLYVFSLTVINP